jgi:hypothetical protein
VGVIEGREVTGFTDGKNVTVLEGVMLGELVDGFTDGR